MYKSIRSTWKCGDILFHGLIGFTANKNQILFSDSNTLSICWSKGIISQRMKTRYGILGVEKKKNWLYIGMKIIFITEKSIMIPGIIKNKTKQEGQNIDYY